MDWTQGKLSMLRLEIIGRSELFLVVDPREVNQNCLQFRFSLVTEVQHVGSTWHLKKKC